MIAEFGIDQPQGSAGRDAVSAVAANSAAPFGDLLAAISHEIRTPLTAVLGFCDLMGREIFGPVGDPRYAAYVRHIADGGAALLKSAEDTLALSALIAGTGRSTTPTEIRLDLLAIDICEALEALAAARSITLDIAIPNGLFVIADARTYRQALTNLIIEAIDCSTDGGEVEISSTLEAGLVRLEVGVRSARAKPTGAPASFAMRIARTLIELDGTRLTEGGATAGTWFAAVYLEPATQHNLFSGAS